MLWSRLSQAWSRWPPALVLVKPDTVLAWHRRGFRLFWTWTPLFAGRIVEIPQVNGLHHRYDRAAA